MGMNACLELSDCRSRQLLDRDLHPPNAIGIGGIGGRRRDGRREALDRLRSTARRELLRYVRDPGSIGICGIRSDTDHDPVVHVVDSRPAAHATLFQPTIDGGLCRLKVCPRRLHNRRSCVARIGEMLVQELLSFGAVAVVSCRHGHHP